MGQIEGHSVNFQVTTAGCDCGSPLSKSPSLVFQVKSGYPVLCSSSLSENRLSEMVRTDVSDRRDIIKAGRGRRMKLDFGLS